MRPAPPGVTSTCGRLRSSAVPTRSSETSSQRPFSASEHLIDGQTKMDFSYSEEQTLLRNSISKYLSDNYKYDSWRKFTRNEIGRDPKHWQQFAELGLLAAPLPEAHGGLGGGTIETQIVMEEFGRHLVVEPYVPTVVIGGGLIADAGSDALKTEWLGKI